MLLRYAPLTTLDAATPSPRRFTPFRLITLRCHISSTQLLPPAAAPCYADAVATMMLRCRATYTSLIRYADGFHADYLFCFIISPMMPSPRAAVTTRHILCYASRQPPYATVFITLRPIINHCYYYAIFTLIADFHFDFRHCRFAFLLGF